MARTIVVGDIHGCHEELLSLLDKIALRTTDRVVATGDLVVKGPKNREVLDTFSRDERFYSVVGNHDLALVKFWRGENIKLKHSQEMARKELQTYGDQYFRYLASLPLTLDVGSHIVVHAGLRPGISLADQSEEDLTELRTLGADRTNREGVPWYELYNDPKTALFGHWPAPEPRRGPAAIGLDTGCVYGYRLTAYVIETGEFVSVAAQEAYDRRDDRSNADDSNKASIWYDSV